MTLELTPIIKLGDLDLTSEPYSVIMDYELGAGEVAYESLASMMLDGELVYSPRTGNRELQITVAIEGPTLGEIASAAAALQKECDKQRNVLTLDPGDPLTVPSAYDTFRAQMTQQRNDVHEQNLIRLFDLTIPAEPWARSTVLTTRPATVPDSTLTIVDDCSSATGWSSAESAPVVSSGAVVTAEATGDKFAGMDRAGAISMSTRPYLVIDWTTSVPANMVVYGHQKDEVMRTPSPFGASWTRSYYYIPEGLPSGVGFIAGALPLGGTLSVTQVATTQSLPDSSTAGHQQSLAIVPGGSARTQAQIEVAHATAGLGEVTVFTAPLGQAYNPGARRWLVSSDTVIVSADGNYQTITGPSIYDVPVATLPKGGYVVAARMACTTTSSASIVWNAQTRLGGVNIGDYQGDSTVCEFTANKWHVFPLGMVTLPPARVGPGGVIRIGIQRDASDTETIYLHDVLLFHESGDLTIVDCGLGTGASGGPSNRLRILPPSADDPAGAIDIASSSSWSDSYGAGAKASQRPPRGHVLHPDGTSVWVMAEGTPTNSPASVTLSWYKRGHTHIDEE